MGRLRIRDVLQKLDAGAPVDWGAIGEGLNASDRELLAELRLLHEVSAAHGGTESPPADQVPQTWGPLQIRGRLGAGRFGQVYRAFEPRLGREVALKILSTAEAAATKGGIIAEGHRLARIRHPNVVTVFGADCIDGRVGVWMELLAGLSLEDELRSPGRLPVSEVIAIGRQLASALTAVHGAGLLHRDIKAQNVLRDVSGRVVLADFGIGLERAAAPNLASGLAGTPLYLAPELLDGHPPSERSDIYSLGVLLYRLATGGYPVVGSDLEQVRASHRAERKPPLAVSHAGLQSVLSRSLAKTPEHRFRTAAEVEKALESATASAGLSGRIVAISAALLGCVTLLLVLLASESAPTAEAVTHRRITVPWRPDLSGPPTPDGRSLVCSTPAGDLALCHLDGGTVRTVAQAASMGCRANGPFTVLSADGATVLFSCDAKDAVHLQAIGIDGTGLQTLLSLTGDEWISRPVGWDPDGRRALAVITMRDRSQQLVRIDLPTGTRTDLKVFTAARMPQVFSVSPDGRQVAYDLPGESSPLRDIVAFDTQTGVEHTIVGHHGDDFAPAWGPDGRLLFSSDRSGTAGTWILRVADGRAAGEPELLHETGRAVLRVRGFTRAGSTLVYALQRNELDVFISTLNAIGGLGSEPQRVFQHPLALSGSPEWSPDGGRLAYLSTRGGVSHISGGSSLTVLDLSTGQVRQFPTDGQPHQATIRWAPDGQSLLYRRFQLKQPPRIDRIDADTGTVLEHVLESPSIADFELSRDGRTIYFAGNGIHAFDTLTKARRQLHRESVPWRIDGFSGIAVSPDERSIAYTCSSGGADREWALRILDVQTGAVRDRIRGTDGISVHGWTADGTALVVTRGTTDGRTLAAALPVGTGDFEPLGVIAPSILQLRLHPEGRRVAFMGVSNGTELWKMENFSRSEAK